jgi:DnaJ like chaperone protein
MLGLGLGLLVGNPLGVVLLVGVGLVAGHLYDDLHALPTRRADGLLEQELGPVPTHEVIQAQADEALTHALCALFLDVARADGPVGREEVRAVREYFADALAYGPEALGAVRRSLQAQLAKAAAPGAAAGLVAESLPHAERQALLEALYGLALADGGLRREELAALRRLAALLALQPGVAQAVERRHVGDGRASYAALGVAEDASDAAVRRAFRRLAAEAHPDRVAHLGREEGERATRRFQQVQQAYAEIRRLRGQ